MNEALHIEKKLKIAILGYRSHPHVGGQGIYLHYLSKALVAMGHEVTVYSGQPYPELASGIKLRRVPGLDLYAKAKPLRSLRSKHFLSYTDLYEWFSKLSGSFAEPYTFGRRLQKNFLRELKSYDIIHDNQSLGYALLNLQNAGCRIVATIHHPIHQDKAFALNASRGKLHRLLIKRWYGFIRMQEKVVSKLDNIITVSEQSRRDIETHFRRVDKPLAVIPNGIDTTIFKPLQTVTRDPLRIITTASSDQPMKGLNYLLDAVGQLKRSIPGIKLVIIGKLKKNSASHRMLIKTGMEKQVEFITGISTSQLVEEYNRSAVAVCPSLYEGFGIPALEAMACGLPLVSTDGGALPELVGTAGITVKAGCSEALASGIKQFLCSDTLRKEYSEKALDRVKQHFSWDIVAARYSNYYLQLTSFPAEQYANN